MKKIILNLCVLALLMGACSNEKIVKMRDYGIVPDTEENLSAKMQEALVAIKQANEGKKVTLLFEKGRYDFHVEGAFQKEYYISNHDQPNPKPVGLAYICLTVSPIIATYSRARALTEYTLSATRS